jgi:hypothetical protein
MMSLGETGVVAHYSVERGAGNADRSRVDEARDLVRGWKPLQHFQTPPDKISAEQEAEPYFYQLDDQFVFAHLNPIRHLPPREIPDCLVFLL